MLAMDARSVVQIVAVVAFTAAALTMDLKTRKIPNLLTVPAFVLGLIFQVWFGGLDGLWSALAGFGLGFGMLLVLWLIGGGGAGDVKLMGALGAWLGGRLTIYVLIFSTIFVALGSVLFLMVEWTMRGWAFTRRRYLGRFNEDRAREEGIDRQTAIRKWRERRRIMPYALPVGLATWLILAWKVFHHSA